MKIIDLLEEALMENFKTDAVVEKLENEIRRITKVRTYEKYKEFKISKNNMEFELIGVTASYHNYHGDLGMKSTVDVELFYTACSKLPKAKREKVEAAKAYFENKKWLPDTYSNTPLWFRNRYNVSLESVLSNDIRLKIE